MMLARLAVNHPNFSNPLFVIPAKAGIHHRSVRFTLRSFRKPPVRVMDSRLRGNDEVGEGNDGVGDGNDEVRKWRAGQ